MLLAHAVERVVGDVRVAQLDMSTSQEQAVAQTGEGAQLRRRGLEEVVVTAQKREQNSIDVPISITAISGDKLTEAGIQNAQDLSFVVPSMAVQEIGPGRQIITIRGIGSQKGTSSLTGLYLDEMSVSGLQDNFIATYIDLRAIDLERAEVLKGPQGTLFGEGSVGGTVRLVTKDPQLDRVGGMISAALFDNADGGFSQEATGVVNLPVIEDELGFRLAATYENNAGWIDKLQTVDGPVIEEDFNDNELVHIRAKALWKPTKSLAVTAMAVVHRNEGGGSNIVNLDPRSESNFIIEFEPNAPTGYVDDYELYNLTATYDFDGVQLLSSTSYIDLESTASLLQRRPIIPNPNPGFQEILQRDYRWASSSFSQEFRLSSSGTTPLNWTVGAFYKDVELASHYISGFEFVRFGQVLARAAGAGLKPTFKSTSWAVFGDVAYALTPRLELGGGVRYFEDDKEAYDAAPINVANTFLEASFNSTTFRSYLSFAASDGVRIYGSVATGFRSGGLNTTDAIASGAPEDFQPEDVLSYELGTKMNLADGRVRVEAALFFSEYRDMQGFAQTTPTVSRPVPIAYITNAGEAEMQGIEWSLIWAATDRLTLSVVGDVTETEITKIDSKARTPPVIAGDPIDFVPEYSWSFGADYGFDWLSRVPGYVRIQYNEQGEMSQTFRNVDTPVKVDRTPVLHFLNAGIGADIGGWAFEIFGRNLLDEDGALRPGGGLTPQARPRTIGVKFEKTF